MTCPSHPKGRPAAYDTISLEAWQLGHPPHPTEGAPHQGMDTRIASQVIDQLGKGLSRPARSSLNCTENEPNIRHMTAV